MELIDLTAVLAPNAHMLPGSFFGDALKDASVEVLLVAGETRTPFVLGGAEVSKEVVRGGEDAAQGAVRCLGSQGCKEGGPVFGRQRGESICVDSNFRKHADWAGGRVNP